MDSADRSRTCWRCRSISRTRCGGWSRPGSSGRFAEPQRPRRPDRVRHGRQRDRRRPRRGGARLPPHQAAEHDPRLRAALVGHAGTRSSCARAIPANTEETLACYEAAGVIGATRVVVTTGGRLAELARADGVPVIPLPAALQPRAAVAYMFVSVARGGAPRRRGAGRAHRDRRGRRASRASWRASGAPTPTPTASPSASPSGSTGPACASTAPGRPPPSRAAGRPS